MVGRRWGTGFHTLGWLRFCVMLCVQVFFFSHFLPDWSRNMQTSWHSFTSVGLPDTGVLVAKWYHPRAGKMDVYRLRLSERAASAASKLSSNIKHLKVKYSPIFSIAVWFCICFCFSFLLCHSFLICFFSLSRLPVAAGCVEGGVAGRIFPRWQLKCFFSYFQIIYDYMFGSQTRTINPYSAMRVTPELFIINWININEDGY